jgi:hypothetical protein
VVVSGIRRFWGQKFPGDLGVGVEEIAKHAKRDAKEDAKREE